jgi:CPA2 family monovalent cation:H+ antiporter-2
LFRLGFPRREIRKYTDVVRSEHYDTAIQSPEEYRALNLLLGAAHAVEVSWVTLASGNPLAGRTLADAKLRTLTGASVVAIRHDETLIPNPPSDILLHPGDQLALIGESSQVAAAESVLTGGAQYSP